MKGLTLIEILIAMGIATVAGVLLLVIIVNSAGIFNVQSAKVESGLNINEAFSKFRVSVKQSNAISDQSNSSQLVLKVSSLDPDGNIIDNTYDDFIFMVDQKKLRFKITPNVLSSRKETDSILAYNIESINFQYFNSENPPLEVTPVNATKVRLTLNLKQKTGADFETNVATSEANLRND